MADHVISEAEKSKAVTDVATIRKRVRAMADSYSLQGATVYRNGNDIAWLLRRLLDTEGFGSGDNPERAKESRR